MLQKTRLGVFDREDWKPIKFRDIISGKQMAGLRNYTQESLWK